MGMPKDLKSKRALNFSKKRSLNYEAPEKCGFRSRFLASINPLQTP
jgi:hypothetical protein